MAGHIINSTVLGRLNDLLTFWNSGGRQLLLFQNNVAVTPATVIANLTECTFSGYARKALNTTWTAAVQIKSGQYESVTAQFTWLQPGSGSQTIFGWAIVNPASSNFVEAAETLSVPFVISPTSGNFVLSLQLDVYDAPEYP